jgi:hypothetical protein
MRPVNSPSRISINVMTVEPNAIEKAPADLVATGLRPSQENQPRHRGAACQGCRAESHLGFSFVILT